MNSGGEKSKNNNFEKKKMLYKIFYFSILFIVNSSPSQAFKIKIKPLIYPSSVIRIHLLYFFFKA